MPTISTPASSQPKNSCWAFPCWKRVRTLYVDTFKGLKVGKRRFSRPTVRVVVPSSRWPVIESSDDNRPATFGFVLHRLLLFVVFVIICGSRSYYTPLWTLGRVIGPEQLSGVLNMLAVDGDLAVVGCSAPPY